MFGKKCLLPVFAVSLLLLAVFGFSDDSDAESTYDNGDAVFSFSTFGSGIESDTYHAILYGVSQASDVLFVPAALDGHNVTEIADGAMSGLIGTKYIVVPKTVVRIGDSAFPSSVDTIYFMGDRPDGKLPEANILYCPGSTGWDVGSEFTVHKIVSEDGSSVDGLSINGNIVIIGGSAKNGNLTIPSVVDNIPVKSVGPYSFGAEDRGNNNKTHRTDLIAVTIEHGVETIRERAFFYQGELKSIVMPDSITNIMDEAFRSDHSLSDCKLPESLVCIGFETFRECSSLKSITIPNSVVKLNDGSFRLCSGAESVTVGTGISEIPPNCFGYGSLLKDVIFLGNISSIGDFAFYMCTDLETFSVPDSVKTIGRSSFQECRSLASIDFGNELEKIDKKAFNSCTSLTEVSFPSSLREVCDDAFWECSSLEKAYFDGELPKLGSKSFPEDTELIADAPSSTNWMLYVVILVVAVIVALYILRKKQIL